MDMELLRSRARFTATVRAFFEDLGYLEVETPALAPALIPEPALEVFATQWIDPRTAGTRPLFLVPSPELWMKRLLARGSGSIFQICKSFRNFEALGRHHNPEFTMLEWYTVGADYMQSADVMESLLGRLAESMPGAAELAAPCVRLSMNQAFGSLAGVDLERLQDRDALLGAVRGLGADPAGDETWEQLFNRLLVSRVEPALPRGRPVLLTDWPSAVPTLARARGAVAERWELYIDGVEVANCFTEETDGDCLARLFEHEAARKSGCRVPHPVDRELLGFFDGRFPPCSGVALGMDRLFMLCCGLHHIDGVIPYSFFEFPLEDRA
jgi:elongation factor P--(R)-beta-lysine ligase